MSNIRIRSATLNDLPAVQEIEESCFTADRRTSARALRRSFTSPRQSVWLALAGREPAGALVLWHYPKTVRIFSVAVRPPFRGAGTGRRLMEHALKIARRAGAGAVNLEADRGNRALVAWYGRFGFQAVRVLQDYYSPGRHAVRMRLALKGGRACGGSKPDHSQ